MTTPSHIAPLLHPLREDFDLEAVLHAVRTRQRGMLLLDYDGTLAPFVEKRDQAVPYPGVREVLRDLMNDKRTRVVIVSGRAVEDLRPLLALDPLPEIWGSHGWERLRSDGRYEKPHFPLPLEERLESEWKWMQQHFAPEQLERKPASLAVHWRGLSDEKRAQIVSAVRPRWEALHEDPALELHAFDGGLELRAAGRNKGDAVRELLREHPSGDPVAYLGDDATDEDAFAVLNDRGLRVLVRPALRETQADIHCIPPEGLLAFLSLWAEEH